MGSEAFVVRLREGGRYGSHLSSRRSHTGPEIQDSELHVGPEGLEVRVMELLPWHLHLALEALGSKLLSPGMLGAGMMKEGRHRF